MCLPPTTQLLEAPKRSLKTDERASIPYRDIRSPLPLLLDVLCRCSLNIAASFATNSSFPVVLLPGGFLGHPELLVVPLASYHRVNRSSQLAYSKASNSSIEDGCSSYLLLLQTRPTLPGRAAKGRAELTVVSWAVVNPQHSRKVAPTRIAVACLALPIRRYRALCAVRWVSAKSGSELITKCGKYRIAMPGAATGVNEWCTRSRYSCWIRVRMASSSCPGSFESFLASKA